MPMDGFYHRQTQFELFPSAVGQVEGQQRPRLFNSPLIMSMENFIVLTVVIVMSMVLSFSYGVERGKKVDGVSVPAALASRGAAVARSVPGQALAKSAGTLDRGKVAVEMKGGDSVASAQTIPLTKAEVAVPAPEKNKAPEKLVDKFYTVQVASYKKGDYAAKAAEGLKQKGYETMVVTKGEHEIVCVGKFGVENEAKKFSQKLKKQYKDCLVRRM
jgi:hypothetical protein